jgi:trafficking protein particle complex subunit 11
MDGYPDGSLEHNVPLLVVAGLAGSSADASHQSDSVDQGVLIHSDFPAIEGRDAEVLQSYLAGVDGRRPPWNARIKDKPYKFRVKTVDRVGIARLWLGL